MAKKSNNNMMLTIGLAAVLVLALGYVFINAGTSSEMDANGKVKNAALIQAADQQQNEAADYPDAPDFKLADLNDLEVSLSDYKGKVVFVNFWATWCGPCRAEIPHFIDLIDEYGDDGFTVLGIALDPREFDRVPGFAEKMSINYPILYDKSGVSSLYGGIQSIPTTFVVNREGKIVDRIIGSRPKEVFAGIVKSWL